MEDLPQLIKGCIQNKRTSQEKLYKLFYPALFLLCRRFFKDERDAMEALNDGMMKVFKNIVTYNERKGQFFNWAYTIVRNAALDKLRRQQLFPASVAIENIELANTDNPLQKLEWKDIYILLDVLAPATRVVCCLFYLENYSVQDISESLRLSTGTVKWHLSDGRKKIKPALEKYHS